MLDGRGAARKPVGVVTVGEWTCDLQKKLVDFRPVRPAERHRRVLAYLDCQPRTHSRRGTRLCLKEKKKWVRHAEVGHFTGPRSALTPISLTTKRQTTFLACFRHDYA
ncbi:unnamed protein product [Protopolystoma xenopodis]|uniref:Uncharacterized protein n=1 Tax=Protopolystoma xenopodis TaxID=117903 RepID=A0A448XKW0_9PLAT|nr:unnamed protein product [Protopolystoma xenopodis]